MKLQTTLLVSFLFFIIIFQAFPQDTRQWTARATGASKNGNNAATAMTIDRSGNIIVTGWITNLAISGIDFLTIKYSPNGEELHRATYTSSGNNIDKALAIAVDTGKSVYVTGISYSSGTGFDYVTIKYDSNLTQLWTPPAKYIGPGPVNGIDQPVAIAVNDSLNVFVTGFSMSTGTNYDYATVKYKSNGDSAWVRRFNNSRTDGVDSALAMSLRGNTDLFVTGTSVDSGYDYFTIKYSPITGDSVWGARYNGSGMGNDIARAIYAKSSSEIYVTGGSQNATGDYDYTTIRYNSTGVPQWTVRYNDPSNGDDQAYALATHGSYIFVTGRSLQVGGYNDMLTVRYNTSGNQGWAKNYNGTAGDDDYGISIIAGGSMYVLGSSSGAGVGKDFAFVKYRESDGREDLKVRFNGPTNSDDIPAAFLESDGAIYVSGTSKKLKGSDFITIKYADLDVFKYRTIIQDSLGGKGKNIKIPGAIPNMANVRDTAFARAYPKIKGGYVGAPGGLILGKANPENARVYGWIRFDKGSAIPAFAPDTGTPKGFDFYGTGPFVGEKKNPKRDKHHNHLAGELIALRINIGASDAEVTPPTFGDITYNLSDSIAGISIKGKKLRDIAALVDNCMTFGYQYPSVNWLKIDTILSTINNAFTSPLKVVSTQPLVITGDVSIDTVIMFKAATSPLIEPLAFEPGSLDLIPERFALHQNYPNPFNPNTTISFDLPEPSVVTLKIYDVLGREVTTLFENLEMDEGYQEVMFDAAEFASGIYFYRLIVNEGQYQHIKKMILIK